MVAIRLVHELDSYCTHCAGRARALGQQRQWMDTRDIATNTAGRLTETWMLLHHLSPPLTCLLILLECNFSD
jgi:hypothetical protein